MLAIDVLKIAPWLLELRPAPTPDTVTLLRWRDLLTRHLELMSMSAKQLGGQESIIFDLAENGGPVDSSIGAIVVPTVAACRSGWLSINVG